MYKQQPYAIVLILMVFFNSCSKHKRSEEKVDYLNDKEFYELNFEKELQNTNEFSESFILNDVVEQSNFITLEATDESLLTDFNIVLYKIEADYFASSGLFTTATSVFQFDSIGKFKRKILDYGQGPLELPRIRSWSGNNTTGNVLMLGYTKAIVYSKQEEKISSIDFEDYPVKIVSLNDGNYVSTTKTFPDSDDIDNPYIVFFDAHGNVIKSLFYSQKRAIKYDLKEGVGGLVYEAYGLYSNYLGEALYKDVFNDTIYKISESSNIVPYISLYRGNLTPKQKDAHNEILKSKAIHIRDIMELRDYFLISYVYNNEICTSMWSKSSQQLIANTRINDLMSSECNNRYNMRYRIPSGRIVNIVPVYAEDNKLYCIVRAEDAMEFVPSVNEDSNPVVMELTLKK